MKINVFYEPTSHYFDGIWLCEHAHTEWQQVERTSTDLVNGEYDVVDWIEEREVCSECGAWQDETMGWFENE